MRESRKSKKKNNKNLNHEKYKKSWKGSGNQNDFFQVCPIMKPKILDEWTLGRV